MIPNLSERLEAIAALVPHGGVVADVCADHALLAIGLASRERVERAIAIDIATAPLALARANVAAARMGGRVEVREGDGLEALAVGEAACAVIAGIGGRAMVALLERGQPHERGVRTLVLQPNKRAPAVRGWLAANGWSIVDEALVFENRRWFPIARVARGEAELDRADELLGPVLRRRGGALFERYLGALRERMARELAARQAAGAPPDERVAADLRVREAHS